MALSRRQFFRQFVNPSERTAQERLTRYSILLAYVRTNLLPYDFGVTDQQVSELMAEVRANLERATNEDLFSSEIYSLIDQVAAAKIQPWREAYWLQDNDHS
jgi:hypothetical protein